MSNQHIAIPQAGERLIVPRNRIVPLFINEWVISKPFDWMSRQGFLDVRTCNGQRIIYGLRAVNRDLYNAINPDFDADYQAVGLWYETDENNRVCYLHLFITEDNLAFARIAWDQLLQDWKQA